MAVAKIDQNSRPTLTALSSLNDGTIVTLYADPTTHRLLVDNAGGASGVTSINADTTQAQLLTVGTSGTDFAIVDNGMGTHTFNLPSASATARGLVTTGNQVLAGTKFLTGGLEVGASNQLVIDTSGNVSTSGTINATGSISSSGDFISQGRFYLPGSDNALENGGLRMGTTFAVTNNGNHSYGFGNNSIIFTNIAGTAVAIGNNVATALLTLGTAGSVAGAFSMAGLTSGTVTFAVPAVAGSDTLTFPAATGTIATISNAQTFTGTQTFSQVVTTSNAITATSNAATVPITSRISTVTNSSAATLTITITTTSAVDGQMVMVRVLDFSAVSQTITWVNTENSTITVPATSNGSTTLPLTVGFQFNGGTSKWRIIALA